MKNIPFIIVSSLDSAGINTVYTEMGIYRDNFLPIIVIAQNNLDLSIIDIAFVMHRRSVVRTAESSMTKVRASNQYCSDQLLI